MTIRKTVRVNVALEIEVDESTPVDQIAPLVDRELAELLTSSGTTGARITAAEIRDVEPDDRLKNFTVVFFIDGDRAVEHFSEEVVAKDPGEAWTLAVKQALDSGCSSSGYTLDERDFAKATEITTLRGHNLSAWQIDRIRAAKADERGKLLRNAGPQVGDLIEQPCNGSDVRIEVADVPPVVGVPLHSGVWAITDQYGERHYVELDGEMWITVPEDQATVVDFGPTAAA